MRVAVTGASGNVGSQVVRRLRADSAVTSVLGVVRRPPDDVDSSRSAGAPLDWVALDLADPAVVGPLTAALRGADAVIHLAWAIQPSHDVAAMRQVNVEGTRRLLEAVAAAAVPAVVAASSVGAYSAGPVTERVGESWPTKGVPTSSYSVDKVAEERLLDAFEAEQRRHRVVRIRPSLVFQRAAGSEIARYFIGPFLPVSLVRRELIPIVPAIDRLAFQVVHAEDVADAFVRATVRDVRGAFNVAGEPVLDVATLARLLGARPVRVPVPLLRALVDVTWRLRLQPTGPGWLDLGLAAPLMDTTRAREELGWSPTHGGDEALLELLDGIRSGAGAPTPPLRRLASMPTRLAAVLRGRPPGTG